VRLAGRHQLLAINFAVVNIWEETAWAGVVQTRLERRHSLLTAALLTAVPFAFTHWPLAFLGEVTVGSAAVGLAGYLAVGVLPAHAVGGRSAKCADSQLPQCSRGDVLWAGCPRGYAGGSGFLYPERVPLCFDCPTEQSAYVPAPKPPTGLASLRDSKTRLRGADLRL
jgi:Type II CAAX prenyl endopeptidase Rce1-like